MNYQLGVYPEISDPNFYEIISKKKEFYDNRISNREKDIYCLEPQQRLLSNYMNPLTLYDSLLVYHTVGVGKTLTAISITEKSIPDYDVIILVKNKSLENNFRRELLGQCSNYLPKNKKRTSEDYRKARKEIENKYQFMTYLTFLSKVFGKNIHKFEKGVIKFERAGNKYKLKNTILVIDEAHNIIANNLYFAIKKVLENSVNVKLILLTATPVYDDISDIFEICNLLNFHTNSLPIRKELLKTKYINTKKITNNLLRGNIKSLTKEGEKVIFNHLKGKVSYLIASQDHFPKRIYEGKPITNKKGSVNIFRVTMEKFQNEHYKQTFDGAITTPDETALLENEEKPSDSIDNVLFNMSSNASVIVYPDGSTGKEGFKRFKNKNEIFRKNELKNYSIKLHSLLDNLDNDRGNAFIYSNFVENNGTKLIRKVLLENGYSEYPSKSNKGSFIVLDNTLPVYKRTQLLIKFNHPDNKNGKDIRIIVGSPIVMEGITFKAIRSIHIIEPYWNLSRIEQVIGRGVRFRSHQNLSASQRNTKIYLYTAISKDYHSIDLIKYELAEEKDRQIKYVENILRGIAIDCLLNKSRNTVANKEDFSRECNYTYCEYKCEYEGPVTTIDNSTYDLKIHAPELYTFIKNKIVELFKIGFVYDLSHVQQFIGHNTDIENVYYVLNDLIKSKVIIKNPLNKSCYIEVLDDLFLVNPINEPLDTDLFYKIFQKEITTLPLKQDHTSKKKTKKKQQLVVTVDLKPGSIYGTYKDKFGNLDNKFRIIDTRKEFVTSDQRKAVNRKVCVFFDRQDLVEIAKYLKLKVNTSYSKTDLCNAIEVELTKLDKIT